MFSWGDHTRLTHSKLCLSSKLLFFKNLWSPLVKWQSIWKDAGIFKAYLKGHNPKQQAHAKCQMCVVSPLFHCAKSQKRKKRKQRFVVTWHRNETMWLLIALNTISICKYLLLPNGHVPLTLVAAAGSKKGKLKESDILSILHFPSLKCVLGG